MTKLPYLAPNVHLPRDGGGTINIQDIQPCKIVLFFYPRDSTSACSKEAKSFTQLLSKFEAYNTKVIGISKDSVKSHEKFIEKEQLAVTLLSDSDNDVCERFGVWKEKSMYGKKYFGIERSTFIIDSKGNVIREWRKVKVPGHAEEVLDAVSKLGS